MNYCVIQLEMRQEHCIQFHSAILDCSYRLK